MKHVCLRVLWIVFPLLPAKPAEKVAYLPIHSFVDASIYPPDSKFTFLANGKVAVTVKWDGTKYIVEDCQK